MAFCHSGYLTTTYCVALNLIICLTNAQRGGFGSFHMSYCSLLEWLCDVTGVPLLPSEFLCVISGVPLQPTRVAQVISYISLLLTEVVLHFLRCTISSYLHGSAFFQESHCRSLEWLDIVSSFSLPLTVAAMCHPRYLIFAH